MFTLQDPIHSIRDDEFSNIYDTEEKIVTGNIPNKKGRDAPGLKIQTTDNLFGFGFQFFGFGKCGFAFFTLSGLNVANSEIVPADI